MDKILSERRSKINFRSFLWHAIFLALASNFMDVDTIIPAMLIQSGGTPFHLGILTAILLGGSSFFQLFFASYLSNKSYKKKYLLTAINMRIISLVALAILFYFSPNFKSDLLILFIFVIISIFAISGSFANISYMDIFGKSVKPEKRKKFFTLKESITSIGVFLSALIVRELLKRFEFPANYSLLFFIAAMLLLIASWGFWQIKEVRSEIKLNKGFLDFFKRIPGEIRANPNLKYYLLLINSLGLALSLLPFLILLAKENFELTDKMVGNFLVFRITGMVLSGLIFYRLSSKINYKTMVQVASVVGALIPIISLFLIQYEFYYQFLFLFTGFFVSVYKISKNGILIEISTIKNRAVYTGISGAGDIVSMIFPLMAGALVSVLGFHFVFILVSSVVFLGFFISRKLDCSSSLSHKA
ncbi:MAG TPA: MFS transporter [Bacteroidales bacterium]|jgi:MFS family permease|nr:MFS transporter [Bacteroidales bacterium]